jgi:hypothetical protein
MEDHENTKFRKHDTERVVLLALDGAHIHTAWGGCRTAARAAPG